MKSKEQLITSISKVINMHPKKLSDDDIETLIFIREKIRNSNNPDEILEHVKYLLQVTGMDFYTM